MHPFYDQLSFIIGHRGACGHAPENTLASFRLAKQLGAKWIETDVCISADGVPYIFHDDRLERCTNGKGLIARTHSNELDKLDAGLWYGEAFRGEAIPRLDAFLPAIQQLGLNLNLEIKSPLGLEAQTTEAIAPIIRRLWNPQTPLILSSFTPHALISARKLLPEYPRGLNLDCIPSDWQARMAECGAESIHFYDPFAEQNSITAVKNAGYKVLCFTINNPQRAAELKNMGVDAVFTDVPDALLKQNP